MELLEIEDENHLIKKCIQAAFGDCNSCHNLFPQTAGAIQELNRQDKLKKKEVMNQCTKCHKELASTDKKGGPVKCKECHQRK